MASQLTEKDEAPSLGYYRENPMHIDHNVYHYHTTRTPTQVLRRAFDRWWCTDGWSCMVLVVMMATLLFRLRV